MPVDASFILMMHEDARTDNVGDLLAGLGTVEREPRGDRYIVKARSGMRDGWIAIVADADVAQDYEPAVLDLVRQKVGNPVFCTVDGRDSTTNFANEFVRSVDDLGRVD